MTNEYIIYCDESSGKGQHFSDFYGGALVKSDHIDEVNRVLAQKKSDLNFGGEVKWSKVPGHPHYMAKYKSLIDCFFDLIEDRRIKIRIMFSQNTVRARNLTTEQIEDKYFILYYVFIKSGFGLDCSPIVPGGVRVRIYPDRIPTIGARVDKFKNYLVRLSNRPEFVGKTNIVIGALCQNEAID